MARGRARTTTGSQKSKAKGSNMRGRSGNDRSRHGGTHLEIVAAGSHERGRKTMVAGLGALTVLYRQTTVAQAAGLRVEWCTDWSNGRVAQFDLKPSPSPTDAPPPTWPGMRGPPFLCHFRAGGVRPAARWPPRHVGPLHTLAPCMHACE